MVCSTGSSANTVAPTNCDGGVSNTGSTANFCSQGWGAQGPLEPNCAPGNAAEGSCGGGTQIGELCGTGNLPDSW